MKFELIALIYKIKFEDVKEINSIYIDKSIEYKLSNNSYYINISSLVIMEQYHQGTVITNDTLRVIFNSKFKITHYELVSLSHVENSIDQVTLVNELGVSPQFSRSLLIAESISVSLKKTGDRVQMY